MGKHLLLETPQTKPKNVLEKYKKCLHITIEKQMPFFHVTGFCFEYAVRNHAQVLNIIICIGNINFLTGLQSSHRCFLT